jgi:hypothetical protein
LILWLSLALQIVSFNNFLDSMDSSRIQNSRNSARSRSSSRTRKKLWHLVECICPRTYNTSK